MTVVFIDGKELYNAFCRIELVFKTTDYKAIKVTVKDNNLILRAGQNAHYEVMIPLKEKVGEDIEVCFYYSTNMSSSFIKATVAKLTLETSFLTIDSESVSTTLTTSEETVTDFDFDASNVHELNTFDTVNALSKFSGLKKFRKAYNNGMNLSIYRDCMQLKAATIWIEIGTGITNTVLTSSHYDLLYNFLKGSKQINFVEHINYTAFILDNHILVLPVTKPMGLISVEEKLEHVQYLFETDLSSHINSLTDLNRIIGSIDCDITLLKDGLQVVYTSGNMQSRNNFGRCMSKEKYTFQYNLSLMEDVARIFQGTEAVKIYKGEDFLCLKSGKITVLIS